MNNNDMREKKSLSSNHQYIELVIIVTFAIIPLFITFPYRINIYLAWEGAYRLYLGQIPFKDFGMPLGYGFWIIPAIFFKIFGPYLFTLVKAQVFINIIAGVIFSSILKLLKVNSAHKLLAVLLFVISYSFVNFWPWYNHTVFLFQLLSLYFLMLILFVHFDGVRFYVYCLLSAFFLFLSIFTKQDGGAFAFCITFFILAYHAIIHKNIKLPFVYGAAICIIAFIIIAPLLKYEFDYWFNYGQEPHSSRLFLNDFLHDIFKGSQWIKFYLLLLIMSLLLRYDKFSSFIKDKKQFTFFLLTLGILIQAILIQVTSYIPHNVNIYFHSFALVFLLNNLDTKNKLAKKAFLLLIAFLIMFWWSSDYWSYGQRIATRIFPNAMHKANNNIVSKHTWMIQEDTIKVSRNDWITPKDMPAFKYILMPPSTVEGIKRLKALDIDFNTAKVLNMSELTPLAHELGYLLESGPNIPLWYHREVALFDREVNMICGKIKSNYYDLVIFENIDYLNDFYPKEIKNCLDEYYHLEDSFLAPREIQSSYIYVYKKR